MLPFYSDNAVLWGTLSPSVRTSPRPHEPLFVATTIRAAIFARVAIVPYTRMARMTLARLDRHKPFAAVLKPLERDGGKRIRCQKAAEHQSKSDKSHLHIDTPMFFLKPTSWNDTGYANARRMASHFARAPTRSSDKNLHWNEEEAHAFAG